MMTFTELLSAVRQPYIEALAQAAKHTPAHVEPAYRQGDGSLATDGALDLPCRADVIPREGASAGQPIQVDSKTQLQFEPIAFDLGTTSVAVSPFVWDWAPFEVCGLSEEAAASALRSWFLAWFDLEDENAPSDEGLYGVVHFMSDLAPAADGWKVTLDLGSASVDALEDLLFRMSDAGAARIRVG